MRDDGNVFQPHFRVNQCADLRANVDFYFFSLEIRIQYGIEGIQNLPSIAETGLHHGLWLVINSWPRGRPLVGLRPIGGASMELGRQLAGPSNSEVVAGLCQWVCFCPCIF